MNIKKILKISKKTKMQEIIIYSPIGNLKIKASEKGIKYLQITEEYVTNISNFDNENIKKHLLQCKKELEEYFEHKRTIFEVELDLEGTPFQKNIWNNLLKIEFGTTTSYLEIAKKINNIPAIRAVGAANGKNPVWIIVPCHRVIASNGNLTGYAGGLANKLFLIEHEKKLSNTKKLSLF